MMRCSHSAAPWSDIWVLGKVERSRVLCLEREATTACLTQSSGSLALVWRGCAPMGTIIGTFTDRRQSSRIEVAMAKWMPTAWARRAGVFGTLSQMAGDTVWMVYMHCQRQSNKGVGTGEGEGEGEGEQGQGQGQGQGAGCVRMHGVGGRAGGTDLYCSVGSGADEFWGDDGVAQWEICDGVVVGETDEDWMQWEIRKFECGRVACQ